MSEPGACPNCHQPDPGGFYICPLGVRHCGCYYEGGESGGDARAEEDAKRSCVAHGVDLEPRYLFGVEGRGYELFCRECDQ